MENHTSAKIRGLAGKHWRQPLPTQLLQNEGLVKDSINGSIYDLNRELYQFKRKPDSKAAN